MVEREEVIELPKKGLRWLIEEIWYLCRVFISSLDRFYWDDGFSRAASLAYTFLLSLVPFTVLCLSILGSFESAQGYIQGVVEFFFKQFVPKTEGVDTVLLKLQEFQASLSSLSALAIPFILVTSILLLNSIEYAMNKVWQVFEARSLSQRISIFCAIIVVAPILAISAYYTTKFQLEPLLHNYTEQYGYLITVYQFLLPFLIDFSAFTCLYFLVPKAPVQLRAALFGAFFSALMFNLAKGGFAWFIKYYSSYNAVYGATLAAIPIFLFWLYCGWIIILLGAEISYQAQYLPRIGKLWTRSPFSVGDGRLVLSVQSLIMISHAFEKGEKLPNEIELAEKLGCSTVVLKPALDALRRAGIITRSDSHEMPLSLAKRPEVISIDEIREALFQSRQMAHCSAEIGKLFKIFAEEGKNPKATLADILR